MFWDLLFHTLVSRSMPKSTVYKLEIFLTRSRLQFVGSCIQTILYVTPLHSLALDYP